MNKNLLRMDYSIPSIGTWGHELSIALPYEMSVISWKV